MEKRKVGSDRRLIITFGAIFTAVMLLDIAVETNFSQAGLFKGLSNRWSDFRINLPGLVSVWAKDSAERDYAYSFGKLVNKTADPRISIAAIDEATLNKLGYPFPRKYYAKMAENLNRLGAKVIVMDILLMDPDKRDPASDRTYVEAVRKAGNVLSLINVDRINGKFSLPMAGLDKASRYIVIPNVETSIDSDARIRRVFVFDKDYRYADVKGLKLACPAAECGEVNLPGLAAGAYAVYKGESLASVGLKYNEGPYPLNFRYPVARRAHPAWAKDNSTTFSVYRHISFLDIIENRLSKEEKEAIKGGILFVGSTAIGAFDHYPSPFMTNYPGVEVHANMLDNMLNEDFLAPVNPWLLALLALVCVWLPIYLRKYSIPVIVFSALGLLGVMAVTDYYFLYKLYDFGFSILAAGLFFPFIFVVINKALVEGREKKWIKSTFGQYLSPKVVEIITKDPSKLSLGGEKREMTAFFLDIAGFTTMSEKMTPEQLTHMLNNYLSGLTDVILRHDGVVDKYIGDCVMAFWNAPLDQKDHRKLACMAAVDCMGEIDRLNKELTEFEIKPSARIGLNSGPMVVGNMGSKMRLSYTVMGDAVNLASRLEGANKYFHSKIMVSEYTYSEGRDVVEARMLGQIRVVGKAIPVKVYEPLARKGKLSAENKKLLAAYEQGFEAFYKGDYGPAKKAFEAALAVMPADGPSRFYLDLAVKYAAAVPKDWDGTFNLTSK